MSSFILGTAQLGSSYGINNKEGELSFDDCFKVLNAAWDNGVRMLDTAEDYGSSEKTIGRYHELNPSRTFAVCTKLSGIFDGNPDALKAHVETTASRIGVESIDTYYLHRFDKCKDDNLMGSLFELQGSGLISKVGISVYEPSELEYIVSEFGSKVGVVQIPFNVFDNHRWLSGGLLARAKSEDIDIFARSVYLQGMAFKDPIDDVVIRLGLSRIVEELHHMSQLLDVPIEQLAFDFVRSSEGVKEILLGCETPEQVARNACLENSDPVWDDELRSVMDELSKELPDYSYDPRKWPAILGEVQ